jgi:hypothetical protein
MLPIKQKTKTSFAKNDPSQDLSKSKYVLVKTNDYMIFFADKVLYPVEWRIFCVLQGCDVHL